jgi:hypothetical protein
MSDSRARFESETRRDAFRKALAERLRSYSVTLHSVELGRNADGIAEWRPCVGCPNGETCTFRVPVGQLINEELTDEPTLHHVALLVGTAVKHRLDTADETGLYRVVMPEAVSRLREVLAFREFVAASASKADGVKVHATPFRKENRVFWCVTVSSDDIDPVHVLVRASTAWCSAYDLSLVINDVREALHTPAAVRRVSP